MKAVLRPSGGHVLDLDSSEIGSQFLSLAHNVNTRKAFPSRMGGRRIAYPVSGGGIPNDALHLLNLSLNTFNWWMCFGASSIFAVEGTNFFDISPVGLQVVVNPYEWTSDLLNGIPIFSNGKNEPYYWNGLGASDAATLPGWPATVAAKALVAFRFHIFAMNLDEPGGIFDNKIMWSDATDPGALPASWTPGAGNEAGSAIIADTPGRCICGVPLGAQLFIYKPTSFYAVEYAGQPPDNIFTIRPVNRSVGALGPHAVCKLMKMGQKHLVVGNDDVVINDGVNVTSIADNRIKIELANSIDEDNAQNVFVIEDVNKREILIGVPEAGSQFATIGHIWDQARDTWVTRDLTQVRCGAVGFVTDNTPGATWDAHTEVWDDNVSAWNAGSVASISRIVLSQPSVLYVEDTTDLITLTATLLRNDLTFDDDSVNKLTSRVYIIGTGLGFADVEFRLGSRQATEDAITWNTFQPAQADGTPYEISGKYISIEVRVTGQEPWTIDKIIIEGKPNGAF